MRTGAFTGVALTEQGFRKDSGGDLWMTTRALRQLPVACLVFDTHVWAEDDPDAMPVAVAVPRLDGDKITVHAVMASSAHVAWNRLIHNVRAHLSVVPIGDVNLDWTVQERIGGRLLAADWTLLSVDLVSQGADPNALVEDARSNLTDEEREVQDRFDRWLADPLSPRGLDLLERARTAGPAALDVLEPLVEPLMPTAVAA